MKARTSSVRCLRHCTGSTSVRPALRAASLSSLAASARRLLRTLLASSPMLLPLRFCARRQPSRAHCTILLYRGSPSCPHASELHGVQLSGCACMQVLGALMCSGSLQAAPLSISAAGGACMQALHPPCRGLAAPRGVTPADARPENWDYQRAPWPMPCTTSSCLRPNARGQIWSSMRAHLADAVHDEHEAVDGHARGKVVGLLAARIHLQRRRRRLLVAAPQPRADRRAAAPLPARMCPKIPWKPLKKNPSFHTSARRSAAPRRPPRCCCTSCATRGKTPL